jgi:quinol-cytochrome oxidoreductase complex cytochrome b subunit
MYTRPSLIGGSLVLWLYMIQVGSGVLLVIVYSWIFDSELPGIIYLWWKTFYGSFLARIHSEFSNLLFFMLYIHILIKIWGESSSAEVGYTWLTGFIIFVFTYVAGITGAITPCSTLSEVTATVIGTTISSLSFIGFDFLETILIPDIGLSDDTMSWIFIFHALASILAMLTVLDHLNNLPCTEYTDEDEMEIIFFYSMSTDTNFYQLKYFFGLSC